MKIRLPAAFQGRTEMNLAGATWAAPREVSRGLNREFRCEAARCGLSVAEAQLLALLHDAECGSSPRSSAARRLSRLRRGGGAAPAEARWGQTVRGFGLSEREVVAAHQLAARLPLWEATLLNRLADVVTTKEGRP